MGRYRPKLGTCPMCWQRVILTKTNYLGQHMVYPSGAPCRGIGGTPATTSPKQRAYDPMSRFFSRFTASYRKQS